MISGGSIKRKLIIILLGLLIGCPAFAGDRVVVIQGLRIGPYEDAAKGIESSCNARVKRIVMSENMHLNYVREVKNMRPDLVIAVGPTALSEMLKLRNIPVIYTMVVNPARVGELPGITAGPINDRTLEWLLDTVPHVKAVGLVYDPAVSGPTVERLGKVFAARDVKFHAEKVSAGDDISDAVRRLKGRVDLLWMIPDATVMEEKALAQLFKSALAQEIPVATFSSRYLAMGALISLESKPFDMGLRTGRLARKILEGRGAAVGDAWNPVQPEIALNMLMAAKLGLRLKGINDSRYIKMAQGN